MWGENGKLAHCVDAMERVKAEPDHFHVFNKLFDFVGCRLGLFKYYATIKYDDLILVHF